MRLLLSLHHPPLQSLVFFPGLLPEETVQAGTGKPHSCWCWVFALCKQSIVPSTHGFLTKFTDFMVRDEVAASPCLLWSPGNRTGAGPVPGEIWAEV